MSIYMPRVVALKELRCEPHRSTSPQTFMYDHICIHSVVDLWYARTC